MSAASPWSVKGIDPKAREIAKDLARRSGMTLGDWLNQIIMEDDDDGVTPLPRRAAADPGFDRRGRSRRLDDAYQPDDSYHRLTAQLDAIAARLEGAERRSTLAITGVDQAVAGLVKRLDASEDEAEARATRLDDLAEEARATAKSLRRIEQQIGPDAAEAQKKIEGAIGSVTGRLYDVEERQRLAIGELRQRVEKTEADVGRARPEASAEIVERVGAQMGARLDAAQARTSEALRSLEQSFAQLDQRLRTAEGRIEPDGARETARFERLAEGLSRQVEQNREEMLRRLDAASTENRLERIERAVTGLNDQIAAAERRSAEAVEAMGREIVRIASNLDQRLKQAESDAEARLSARLREAGEGVSRKFNRSVETLGEALNARIDEQVGALSARLDAEMIAVDKRAGEDARRLADAVDQRMTRAGDQHVLALEKLGGEIARISERLGDRIAQSERRSATALEDIADRMARAGERSEQQYARATGELSERMRLSEERTARLLGEARDAMQKRAAQPRVERVERVEAPFDASAPDWRLAAFPDEGFGETAPVTGGDGWSDDDLEEAAPPPAQVAPLPVAEAEVVATPVAPAPFGVARAFAESAAPEPVLTAPLVDRPAIEPAPPPSIDDMLAGPEPVLDQTPVATPTAGFGGADVSDVFAAIAPGRHQDPEGAEDAGGDSDFVDAHATRRRRAAETRDAIAAARAAMGPTVAPPPSATSPGFGFAAKKGGKSKLQQRLDRQASRDGGTVKKALLASVTAVALTGGVYGYMRVTDSPLLDRVGASPAPEAADGAAPLIAASLTTPGTPTPPTEGEALYGQALEQLDAGAEEAVATLTRAANLGYAPAQFHLARLYEDGAPGLEPNDAEARVWTQRAAEGGEVRAMHNLGLMLYEGTGGERDQAGAAEWFEQAAERGLADSQYNLAKMYDTGAEGVARDPAEALRWYLIAARAGDGQAQADARRLSSAVPVARRAEIERAAEAFTAAG